MLLAMLNRLLSGLGRFSSDGCVVATDSKLHVCYLLERLDMSGTASRVVALCNNLDSTTIMASCISLGPRSPLVVERLEPRVQAFGLWGPPSIAVQIPRVAQLLRRYRVDVLHVMASSTSPSSAALVVGAAAAWIAGSRAVYSGPLSGSAAQRLALRLCSRVVVSDEEQRHRALSLRIESDSVRLIPVGVDTVRFHPVRSPQDSGSRPLVLGSLDSAAAELVVQVVTGLCQAGLPARGLVRSRDPALPADVSNLPLHRDVAPFLGAMDLYLSTRRGSSQAVLEAMACGVGIIATAPTDLVESGTGILLDTTGEADLAPRVARAVQTMPPGQSEAMGHAARRLVERRFPMPAVVAAHEDLYRALARPPVRRSLLFDKSSHS